MRVLFADIDGEWGELRRIHDAIALKAGTLRKDTENEDMLVSLAYYLHNYYSACETIFKQIAGFFENQIEDLPRFHIDLLKRMCVEIEDFRPRFLSVYSFAILDELRGFRHVFRHAYGYKLDADRVLKLAEKVLPLQDLLDRDLEQFKARLRN